MATRYEEVPQRTYEEGFVKKRPSETNWDTAPSFSVITAKEVQLLTGLSLTAIQDRINAGTFPSPGKDGKRRVWSLGAIRRWCEKVAGEDAQ